MKNFVLITVAVLFIACGSTPPLVPVSTTNIPVTSTISDPEMDQVTMVLPDISKMTSVQKTLEFLAADELQGRDTGSPEIEMAAQFIEARFEHAGVKPYYETYRDEFIAMGKEAFNIVGVLHGSDPLLKKEVVLIGAHYDHIGTGKAIGGDTIANGANDNAAGTTAVLALADHFAKTKSNKRTLVFALFSAEEKGLLGSKHLAKKMKEAAVDLYMMYNIEMIGVPMEGKDHLVYASGYELSNFPEKFNEYTGNNLVGFLPKAKEFNLFMRSDNYPFYQEFTVPAHTVSSFDFTNFEHYHSVKDEVELIDIPFMEKLIAQMATGLEGILSSPTKEIMIK
ncbi:M20/M25/M40 family metallo-hydrolase [Dokdonia sp. Hel_I_53]|uniref:M20/M25/M40 family metallo-hydrolase n=1 Tax=Dokdonia sp. Hel_I_53 TaxID=1566287 RepID=UPI001644563D|nr:M20/M25/M40 family metallo-hydrolase [Dokdonia sp. Hel_I_53]